MEIPVGAIVTFLGLFFTLLGIVFTILTFSKNRDKDVKSEATKEAVIETKLDHISKSVDSIKIDIKANDIRWTEINNSVIRIDESVKSVNEIAKSAHKRIDNLEKGSC